MAKAAAACYCKHQQSCRRQLCAGGVPTPGNMCTVQTYTLHPGSNNGEWELEVFSQVLSLAGINVQCSKSATKFSQKDSCFLCLYEVSSKCVAGETQVHKEQQCGTGLMSPVFPWRLCSWGLTHFKQYKKTRDLYILSPKHLFQENYKTWQAKDMFAASELNMPPWRNFILRWFWVYLKMHCFGIQVFGFFWAAWSEGAAWESFMCTQYRNITKTAESWRADYWKHRLTDVETWHLQGDVKCRLVRLFFTRRGITVPG